MPILLDRRAFLTRTLVGAASLSVASRFAAADPKSSVHWAILSDTHIAADKADTYRSFHPHENLQEVLSQVRSGRFDLMLINGDLARMQGQPGDYEMLTGYLEPITARLPLAITLGNHDDRKNARGAVASISGEVQPVEKKLVTLIDAGPVDFILLDSLMVTNIAAGQLGQSQRDWLSGYLGEKKAKPAVVFVHHNLDPEDDNALVDASRLLDILRPASRVKAVFFGHTHAWKHEKQGGLHLVNVPAVGYNFKDSEPVGWTAAEFSASGAKLTLTAIAGNMQPNGQVLDLAWR
jgi:3',5'-cyclic AMP phosphodiesterase CpdA